MKTTYTYDHYVDYTEMKKRIEFLKEQYPTLLQITSLATTPEGKEVLAVTITNTHTGLAKDKPAYYIDANIHAGEVTGSMSALYVIDALCTNASDSKIALLLENYTYYIIPKVSPDGADAYLNSAEKLRSTNRNYPYPEKEDGLHPADMDDDGVIRMMRFKSPYGAWKVSEKDPRIMSKRLPTESHGCFYHIYPEGYIQNYDGINITLAKNKWGLDFNRNFPFGWFSEMRQPGSGAYPLNQPETKALSDFILEHPNIGFVSALHTTGGVLIYPPGTYSEKDAILADMKIFHDMGKSAKQLTGYETKNVFDEFLVDTKNYSSGAFDDWCYETQGIPAYTIELWDCLSRAGIPYDIIRKSMKSDDENENTYTKVLAWIDENLGTDAFKPWTLVQHPQLGAVEIGGFDFKFTIQNPPVSFLEQEVKKIGAYLIDSALALPYLSIDNLEITELGTSIYQLDITVGNKGYLGTHLTQKAIEQGLNIPVILQVEGDLQFIQGEQTTKLGDLKGFGSTDTGYGYDGILTQSNTEIQKKCTLIVKAQKNAPFTITVSHPKAGKVTQSLQF